METRSGETPELIGIINGSFLERIDALVVNASIVHDVPCLGLTGEEHAEGDGKRYELGEAAITVYSEKSCMPGLVSVDLPGLPTPKHNFATTDNYLVEPGKEPDGRSLGYVTVQNYQTHNVDKTGLRVTQEIEVIYDEDTGKADVDRLTDLLQALRVL
jgi:hypothetical protein